ncbi:hypothetical protein C427_4533 [Paraglaciecola psychrophila 170]|uniref:Uncharacterized protein n=1 Tax=Paraglaciecola psychrophila 170 TaxID=1129794 RepID=M4S7J4_9ALTE|nr:hypothetical protein C427_4533 [Paraglaciecola psychrophila 170]
MYCDDLDYDGTVRKGYHQIQFIPDNTGAPLEFMGSTTGSNYTEDKCSTIDVTWSVRHQRALMAINSLTN